LSFRVVRSAQASWQGAVADGSGRIALGSGAFDGPYSLRARVEESGRATNPEELIGAAEAACFTMSLANLLSEAGHPARDLRTTARVTLAQVGAGFNITRIELRTVGEVPAAAAAAVAATRAAPPPSRVSPRSAWRGRSPARWRSLARSS